MKSLFFTCAADDSLRRPFASDTIPAFNTRPSMSANTTGVALVEVYEVP